MDELQRRIQLEACLLATTGTIFIVTAFSLLTSEGIRMPRLQHGLGWEGTFRVDNSSLHFGQYHRQSPLSMKNKLRELRAVKEWSQSDLADKLGVSRQTVNAIETERYDPSMPLAFKIARLFKQPVESIFSDNGT
jgi:putative transcriptional regulator